ncbi:pantothenate kinase 4 [Anoplophora glabripennis]|uniref:pantothenate kinase 4 n=1 Tax=Anoplophora glabripennis TaxID=217634 RepID=UPI000874D76E|nr:pantothenate kinase 4 [Anoplophora glabripennis]
MTGNEKKNICPLLKNPELYNPDTIDLFNNAKERNYWLPCLEQMVKKFVNKAGYLNPDDPCATEKAEMCFQKFHRLVEELSVDPSILKPLSVRTLLEFNEDNLRANNFKDPWLLQKERESDQALNEFEERIRYIDSIADKEEKWLELTKGVLAGNVFDWGAKAVSDILEQSQNFGLREAMGTIQKRPWFIDNLNAWITRLKKHPYKTSVIFVDNSGVDFILGILPMARELLSHGTKVVITANSTPALNDVTYHELNLYCCKAAQHCPVLKESIASGQLVTVENGQKSPCLDLTNLSSELCSLMKTADLIVLEGMGRAVHTNLYAKFTVDCVKLAVLKNEWLAQSLGTHQFSVICDFEHAS